VQLFTVFFCCFTLWTRNAIPRYRCGDISAWLEAFLIDMAFKE